MADAISEDERNDTLDELIKCSICLDYFDDPRIAPCFHTYCLKCIQRMAESNQNRFQCPLRDGATVDRARIDSLPVNRIVRDIVALVVKSKAAVQCSNCRAKNAEVWCRDCQNKGYCSECCQNIHNMPAFSDHRPCEPTPPKVTYCSTHPTRELEFWCEANDNIYCANCLADKQDAHLCVPVSDGMKKIADKIKQLFQENRFSTDMNAEVQKMKTEYEKTSNAKKTEVAESFRSARQMIDNQEKSVLEAIAKVDESNMNHIKAYEQNILAEWRTYREQCELFNLTVRSEDHVQVLREHKDYEQYLNEANRKWLQLIPPINQEYNIHGLNEFVNTVQHCTAQVVVKEQPVYENSQLQQVIELQKMNTNLNLNNKGLNDSDMMIVAQAIRMNQTFTVLYLGNNQIKAKGAKCISDALWHNRTLTSIDLWNNQIEDQGVQYLMEGLSKNRALQSLGLNTNKIKKEGAEHVANFLKTNKTLEELFLVDNNIGDEGAQLLLEALRTNRTIKKLQIFANNDISAKLRQRFEKEEKRFL